MPTASCCSRRLDPFESSAWSCRTLEDRRSVAARTPSPRAHADWSSRADALIWSSPSPSRKRCANARTFCSASSVDGVRSGTLTARFARSAQLEVRE